MLINDKKTFDTLSQTYDTAMFYQNRLLKAIVMKRTAMTGKRPTIKNIIEDVRYNREPFDVTKPLTINKLLRLCNYGDIWFPIMFDAVDASINSMTIYKATNPTNEEVMRALIGIFYSKVERLKTEKKIPQGAQSSMSLLRNRDTNSCNLVTFLNVLDYSLYYTSLLSFCGEVNKPKELLKNRVLRKARNGKLEIREDDSRDTYLVMLDRREKGLTKQE